MRVVFAGTPEFAVPCLMATKAGAEVVAVLTQPDRPAGRGRGVQMSPVKQAALQAGIAVHQPESLKQADAQSLLRALAPDVMVVVAYGQLLPQAVLDIPRHGCWNIHASLLPRWRGAAPIQRAIEAGDAQTGVCLMQMERGLDTGPVILQRALPIAPDDSAGRLHDRLAALGAELLAEGLARLSQGSLPPARAQPAEGVSYAHKLEKAEALLDWQQPAEVLARKVRAFHPWPVAEADIDGERLRIHQAEALPGTAAAPLGHIVAAGREGIDVATGAGILRIGRLQKPGGKVIGALDFANARHNRHAVARER